MTYALLNKLEVIAADVQNAFLQASSSEKHYVIYNDGFGIENRGKVTLICWALYCGKLARRDHWLHMRSCMKEIGFTSCQGDPDVWMKPCKKNEDETM